MTKTKKGKIIILSGPSGSGKTTIHERILSSSALKGKVVRSVSVTTRPMRANEKNGRDYFFTTPKMFLYKIRAGHFLEWARVFDHYYGTPHKNVNDLLAQGKSVLLCIDVQGAAQILKKRSDSLAIFIKPPSLKDLEARLLKRGTESPASLKTRLDKAKEEMSAAAAYDAVVVNDDLESACAETERLIAAQLG